MEPDRGSTRPSLASPVELPAPGLPVLPRSTARERWREEKMAAENVIRGLLLQLEIMVSGSPETLIPIAPLQAFAGADREDRSIPHELIELIDAA